MTGRRSPAGRDTAAQALGSYLPALGVRDAALLIDRIGLLLDAGESVGNLLARTNGPARRDHASEIPQLAEPAPSKSTAAAFARVPDFVEPVAAEVQLVAFPYVENVAGVDVRFDLCRGCGAAFGTPKRNTPGRYPVRCPKCRGIDPRSTNP